MAIPSSPASPENGAANAGARNTGTPRAGAELWIAGRLVQPDLNRVLAPAGPERPDASRDTEVFQVEPKVMQVLLCLARSAGEVVTRDDLLREVWEGAFVSDDVLTRSIGQLRRIFGDDPERPRIIETIRKRGYRLIALPARGVGTSLAQGSLGPAALPPADRGSASETVPSAAPPGRRAAGIAAAAMAAAAALLALLAWAGWHAWSERRAPRSGEAAGGTPVRVTAGEARRIRLLPVTALPGTAVRPALSPDGTRLVFSWNGGAGRDFHLYVAMLGAGAPPLRLTSHAGIAADTAPAWSPDGTVIAFSRRRGESCELFAIPARGGGERRLRECGSSEDLGVAWSPDGRWLAFTVRESGTGGAAGPESRLELLSPRTLATRRLTQPPPGIYGDYAPVFSPDGGRVAFVRAIADRVEDVYVVPVSAADPAANAVSRITFDSAGLAGLDWMAGGRELVFSSSRGGIFSLWRVAAEGGTPRLLAGGGTKIKHPTAARQRDVVAFESWAYDVNLWRVTLGSGAAEPFGGTVHEWSFQPQFSPDGRRVAFGSTRSGSYEIWLSGASGEAPAQLTSLGGPYLGTPRWSPDGRRLAFTAWPEGSPAIYLIEAGGGVPARLTAAGTDAQAPSWSADGRTLYFASRRSGSWQVWSRRLDTGVERQVTAAGGFAAAESPDGAALCYSRLDRPGLVRHSLATGAETLVAPAFLPGDWGSWAASRDGIHYLGWTAQGDPTLAFFPFADGKVLSLAPLPGLAWPGFALAPDRRSLLYARSDRSESNIVRLENP